MLTRNIKLIYISQIYTIISSVIFIPYFISVLGEESYGLVGFFGSMQAWLTLLDVGLISLVLRETTYYSGRRSEIDIAKSYSSFCRVLHLIFMSISLLVFIFVFFFRNYLADSWFEYESLSRSDVVFCISLMGLFVASKFLSGFYRAIVSGVEDFKTIAYVSILVATIRYVSVVFIFYFFYADIKLFFVIQFIASLFECFILYMSYKNKIPCVSCNLKDGLLKLKKSYGFAYHTLLISLVYMVLTQFDKVYLSRILSLSDYGVFSLSLVFSTLITMGIAPIQHVIQPRLTAVFVTTDRDGFYMYFKSLYMLFFVIVMFITGFVILLTKPVLLFMDYDLLSISYMMNVVLLYSVGNMFFSLISMFYFLQYSQGFMKYHVYSFLFIAVLYVIFVILFSERFGPISTGFIWLSSNLFYILCFVPIILSKVLSEYRIRTYFHDLFMRLLPFGFLVSLGSYYVDIYFGNYEIVFLLLLLYVALFSLFYGKVFFINIKCVLGKGD